jgi:hypothetical protein
MAFADPQSVTVDGTTATPLPRVLVDGAKSEYSNPDKTAGLVVQHAYGKRNRHTARLNISKIAPDPFTGVNQRYSASAYIVIDAPTEGLSQTELKNAVLGLTKWLSDTTGANTTKLLGGES